MEKLGYEAAKLLARLMAGKRAPRKPVHLPPVRVVVRQSTDVMAIIDRDMVQVLRYIREHANEPITVRDVLRAVPVSRRALEQRFRALLGRSPLQVIRRAHIERAKQLLTDTDMQMPAVADASGFANAARLSLLFRRETGMTPSEFRHRSRIH
jgi:LacI family transcriptional regulator